MPRYTLRDHRCPRCKLSRELCICADIPELTTRTRVVLVAHHRELDKPTGTGNLALAALPHHQRLVHGLREGADDPSRRVDLGPLFEEGRRVLLLYPREGARTLDAALVAEDPRPVTLVVPDGNWNQAASISRRVPGIDRAEPVVLPLDRPTEWGLRDEPHLGGLATFEAIARALGVLEGEAGPALRARLEELFRLHVRQSITLRGTVPALHKPAPAPAAPLELLYLDEQLAVVNKPSGALVHRGWGGDAAPVLQVLRDQLGQRVFPVHRLDRGTSGALVFALCPSATRLLQASFESGAVEKRYLCLSRGRRAESQRIDHPLEHGASGERVAAITDVRLLGSADRYGLYEALPRTGRTHQIRRHFKHLRQPLIGDHRYGTAAHNLYFREQYGFDRLALHCHALSLPHPTSGQRLELSAPLPQDFAELLGALGLEGAVAAGAGGA